jgi:hypothetical protein
LYSTCLFCKARLGSNEEIEHFPVGSRLAFDAAKGRLWVVCRRCTRWNLTPLEERWEAVEECERRFATTHIRYSTEQVGLARLSSGLELVRVGRPNRPEFAAWRYGARFTSRYRRYLLWSGVPVGLLAASVFGGAAVAAFTGGSGMLLYQGAVLAREEYSRRKPLLLVPAAAGGSRLVRGREAGNVKLVPGGGAGRWALMLGDGTRLRDEEGVRAAGLLLPHLNAAGGSRKSVDAAVRELDRVEHPHRYFTAALNHLEARRLAPVREYERYELLYLPHEIRLALEMAAHEEVERQALDGELRALEVAWREAEEIAAIADRLLLPAAVEDFIARHRRS